VEDLGLRRALDALLDRLPTDQHGRFNASEVIHAAWWDAGWTQYLRDAGWVGGREGGRRCRRALVEEGDDPCLVWLRRHQVVQLLPTRLPEKENWWKSQLGSGVGTTAQGGELVEALAPHKRCEKTSMMAPPLRALASSWGALACGLASCLGLASLQFAPPRRCLSAQCVARCFYSRLHCYRVCVYFSCLCLCPSVSHSSPVYLWLLHRGLSGALLESQAGAGMASGGEETVFREIFDLMDVRGEGWLSEGGILWGLRWLGCRVSEFEVHRMVTNAEVKQGRWGVGTGLDFDGLRRMLKNSRLSKELLPKTPKRGGDRGGVAGSLDPES
jgi:hypothetical protein